MSSKQIPTVGTSVYQRIKRDIIFGDLEPGANLKLNGLKARYAASLSTLRETLSRLASEGFVEAPEQRGFFVTPVSAEDLTEIANLRILLECHAIEQSVALGDVDWEGDLVAAHHKLDLSERRMLSGDHSDKETWKRYDWEFQLALIRACNLLEILDDRFERRSVIVTSQLPVSDWYQKIPEPTVAHAMFDRLVHGAIRFELHGTSMRAHSAEAGK